MGANNCTQPPTTANTTANTTTTATSILREVAVVLAVVLLIVNELQSLSVRQGRKCRPTCVGKCGLNNLQTYTVSVSLQSLCQPMYILFGSILCGFRSGNMQRNVLAPHLVEYFNATDTRHFRPTEAVSADRGCLGRQRLCRKSGGVGR